MTDGSDAVEGANAAEPGDGTASVVPVGSARRVRTGTAGIGAV